MNLLDIPFHQSFARRLVPGMLVLHEGQPFVVDEVHRLGDGLTKIFGNYGDGLGEMPSTRRRSVIYKQDDPVQIVPDEHDRLLLGQFIEAAVAGAANGASLGAGLLSLTVRGVEFHVPIGEYFSPLVGADGAEGAEDGADVSAVDRPV